VDFAYRRRILSAIHQITERYEWLPEYGKGPIFVCQKLQEKGYGMSIETLATSELQEIASACPWYGMRSLGGFISSVTLTIFDGFVVYDAPRFSLFGRFGVVELLLIVLDIALLISLANVYRWTYRSFRAWRMMR